MAYQKYRTSGINQGSGRVANIEPLGAFKAVTGFDTVEEFHLHLTRIERHRMLSASNYRPWWVTKGIECSGDLPFMGRAQKERWQDSMTNGDWVETDIEGMG